MELRSGDKIYYRWRSEVRIGHFVEWAPSWDDKEPCYLKLLVDDDKPNRGVQGKPVFVAPSRVVNIYRLVSF